jgi:hypothetical protein
LKAEEIVDLIRKKYPSIKKGYNPHVVLEQVPDGTTNQNRWVDVAVFSMWESLGGLTRSAFEIKVTREDFLNELRNPEKHQWCKECFHEFWFVAPKDVINIDELPSGSGWMYPTHEGNKLMIARQAPRNDNPRLDDQLLSAFMRAAGKVQKTLHDRTYEDKFKDDHRYKTASRYEEAVNRYLHERGIYDYPQSDDDVYKNLLNATLEKSFIEERDNFLGLLQEFQHETVSLMNFYIVLAKKSLTLRDQYGKFVVNSYGGKDEGALEELKKMMKAHYNRNLKPFAEVVEILSKLDLGGDNVKIGTNKTDTNLS